MAEPPAAGAAVGAAAGAQAERAVADIVNSATNKNINFRLDIFLLSLLERINTRGTTLNLYSSLRTSI
jgi:hypothetical protein